MNANLKNSILDSQDLGRFASDMYNYKERYNLSAKMDGLYVRIRNQVGLTQRYSSGRQYPTLISTLRRSMHLRALHHRGRDRLGGG